MPPRDRLLHLARRRAPDPLRRRGGGEAPELLARHGYAGYVLLTTPRAEAALPELGTGAWTTLHVPAGRVDELSAELLARRGGSAAWWPWAAAGSWTPRRRSRASAGGPAPRSPPRSRAPSSRSFHRTPKGVAGARLVRPSLVLADPAADGLAAATGARRKRHERLGPRNGVALHARTQTRWPSWRPCAGAELIASGVSAGPPVRDELALGACWRATPPRAPASPCTTPPARRSCARPAARTPRRTP